MGCICWDSVFINKTIIEPLLLYKNYCTQGWNIDPYTIYGTGLETAHACTPIDHNCFGGVQKLTLCHRNCIVRSAATILA